MPNKYVEYHPERTMRPRPRISGRAAHWLRIAALVATKSVNSTHICEELEISRNTFTRHLADMERVYGFVVEYVRHPDGGKNGGWYEIRDWGVLNSEAVISRYAGQLV